MSHKIDVIRFFEGFPILEKFKIISKLVANDYKTKQYSQTHIVGEEALTINYFMTFPK